MNMESGVLYLVATPVGNLEDITFRALDTLKQVDFIAAEDTRHTLKLLNHFDIKKPMISYYEHNIRERGEEIVKRLKNGESAALVTDAGTPAISDPGEDIVKLCVQEHIRVVPIPGAVAAINALICSSLPTSRFSFEGFLSVNKKSRMEHLTSVKNSHYTLIFYEAPHKLLRTLRDMLEQFGDRRMTVAREMTKKYEEFIYTTISGAITHFEQLPPKGEFVLVIEGANNTETASVFDTMSVTDHMHYYMQAGLNKKDAMKKVAQDRGVSKREIYAETLKD